MRATRYKHFSNTESKKPTKAKRSKKGKVFKFFSFCIAIVLVTAVLVIPTTTLAPNVNAFEDSKMSSYSIGDIDAFSPLIADNCVATTTVETTQETTKEPDTTSVKPKKAKKVKKTQATKQEPTESVKSNSVAPTQSVTQQQTTVATTAQVIDQSGYLVQISNPDTSYSPQMVSLSTYDREKLERLVMGEAGSMGYTGCALVAQSIRDAMNRSHTTSIDSIISTYQYFGSTSMAPNSSVKKAVSFIFDNNGSAVQHRILCFYTGSSQWHETQKFIVGCGTVRFFDLR